MSREVRVCAYTPCSASFSIEAHKLARTCSKSHAAHLQYQENPSRRKVQAINAANSTSRAKKEATSLERYGVKSFSNFEKQKATRQSNFGVETSFHHKETQDKVKATVLERYGVANPAKAPEIAAKIAAGVRRAFMDKYGVVNPGCLPEIQAKAMESALKNFKLKGYHSKPETALMEGLDAKPKVIQGFSVDGVSMCGSTVIEYDGAHHHGRPGRYERDLRKTEALLSAGYKVARVREAPLASLPLVKNQSYLELTVPAKAELHSLKWSKLLETLVADIQLFISGDAERLF